MRILYVNNYYYLRGGSERVLFQELEAMKAAGHEVAVFTRRHADNLPTPWERFYSAPIETQKIRLDSSTPRTLRELIYSSENREAIRRMASEFRPDVAHAHNIYGRLSTSVLDGLTDAGVPTLLTLHDYKLICPSYLMVRQGRVCEDCKAGFHKALLGRCLKGSYLASAVYAFEAAMNARTRKYDQVARFVSPSRFLKDKFAEFGVNRDRIAFVPNCVDASEFEPTPGTGRHLLYLGRLSAEKGVGALIAAYARLPKDRPPLVIAGDGPERGTLEKQAAGHKDVLFTGYLSGQALKDALSDALAMAVPSEWYENAPMTVLEAMAQGKPVVGARIGGITEMIGDGVTGLLFEAGNVEDLTGKLSRLLALDSAGLKEMGMAARERVERLYLPQAHNEALLKLYETVASPS